jgi:hypothetical protein
MSDNNMHVYICLTSYSPNGCGMLANDEHEIWMMHPSNQLSGKGVASFFIENGEKFYIHILESLIGFFGGRFGSLIFLNQLLKTNMPKLV